MPGEVVGQPAAKCRAHRRRRDDSQAIQREGLRALLRRKSIGEDRLLRRRHAAAADTLNDPREQDHRQRG